MARWLLDQGYTDVSVLSGGLSAWRGPLVPIDRKAADHYRWAAVDLEPEGKASAASDAFLPLMLGRQLLAGQELPIRRDMTVLFVDMVESTPLLWRHPTERVLELVQEFMEVVVDAAVHHCGDVHDFQGDGALLYFEGPGEAVPAAFRLCDDLAKRREKVPDLPKARIALDTGPLVIGLVGTPVRRSLSFVGPSINVAARILKHGPPGGIIATGAVVSRARTTDPELAARFRPLGHAPELRGIEAGDLELFVVG